MVCQDHAQQRHRDVAALQEELQRYNWQYQQLQQQAASLQQQAAHEQRERSEAKVQLALLFADRQRNKAQLKQLRLEVEQVRAQAARPLGSVVLLSGAAAAGGKDESDAEEAARCAGVSQPPVPACEQQKQRSMSTVSAMDTMGLTASADMQRVSANEHDGGSHAGTAAEQQLQVQQVVAERQVNPGAQQLQQQLRQARQLPSKRSSSSPDSSTQPEQQAAKNSRLPRVAGIHEVAKPKDMQQLQALLAASPAWGFSVAFDTDGAALPRPTGRTGVAAAVAAAAAAADDEWLLEELRQQQQGQQQRQHRSKEWSWSVLGVAFSVADACAYYVPLTRKIPGVVEAAGDPRRVGSSERLRQLWQGLADIFTSSKDSGSGLAGSSSIAAVAAASNACTAAVDALVAPAIAAAATTGRMQEVDLSRVCPPVAAAEAWGFGSSNLNSSSSTCASLGASYGLKSQLAALASPPPASGFAGFVVDAPVVDVRIAAWLLQPDDKGTEEGGKGPCGRRPDVAGLQALLARHAGQAAVAAALGPQEGPLAAGGTGLRHLAACRRACLALKLHNALAPRLQADCAIPALMGVEMPLVAVLAAMEARGMPCRPAALSSQAPAMDARLAQLEAAAAAYNTGGAAFSLTATKKVRQLLFDKLKLKPPARNSHTRGGEQSSSCEVLQALAAQHPLPGLILQHRKLHKLKTGFMTSLGAKLAELQQQQQQQQQAAASRGSGCTAVPGGAAAAMVPAGQCALSAGDSSAVTSDGSAAGGGSSDSGIVRICGSFLQTNTATGRLSMDDPALQTIPRPVDFLLELPAPASQPSSSELSHNAGGVQLQQVQVNVRAAFVAPPGWVLLSADYSQVELRLMAHLSQDPQLLAALAPHQSDPFKALAAQWLHLPQEQVTPVQRGQAKRLAYGLLYGMGAQALAAELGVEVAEALRLADDFRRSHAALDAWMACVVRRCTVTGWVATLAGRRRRLPGIRAAGNGWGNEQQAQAARRAVNTTCQGSAADVVKGAMVVLAGQLRASGLGKHCRLLLQVHDELLFEVARPHLQQVSALVRDVMEGAQQAWGLSVAVPVKVAVGPSWGQLQEYREHDHTGGSSAGAAVD
ncbi:hypothetical protein COO60DRAFT_1704095 [Scenedesmus sp. NREL 46B-D3]|nr:hypothetical protein COO60DRAFT_1704095 [Scenedesmus sp. NREL 46B-D3]